MSYEYSCDGDSGVYNVYSGASCSGDAVVTPAPTVEFNCDGITCDYFTTRTYVDGTESGTCGDDYVEFPYALPPCIEVNSTNSASYDCSGSGTTANLYAGTECSGSVVATFSQSGDLDDDPCVEVTCSGASDAVLLGVFAALAAWAARF